MSWRMVGCRSLIIIALTLCTLIAVDYYSVRPALCSFRAGCDDVFFSAYGSLLGLPLPLLGVAGFGAALVLSLSTHPFRYRLFRAVALLGGTAGAALVLIQVVILGRLCWACLCVDACAVALAVTVWWPSHASMALPPHSWPANAAWSALAVGCCGAALALPWLRAAPAVPEQVKCHWTPGVVSIVVVTDFDCAHCRRVHLALEQLLDGRRDQARLTRLVVALPRHAHSRPAARAYLAARAQGQGDAMATALYSSTSLSAEACRRLALDLRLDMAAYDHAVANTALDAEIDATMAWAQSAGSGPPLVWIEDQFFQGDMPMAVYRRAFERMRRRVVSIR